MTPLLLLPTALGEALDAELKEMGWEPLPTNCPFCGRATKGTEYCSEDCQQDYQRMQDRDRRGDELCHEILERR